MAALEMEGAPTGRYADTVRDLTDAFQNQDIPAMQAALDGLGP